MAMTFVKGALILKCLEKALVPFSRPMGGITFDQGSGEILDRLALRCLQALGFMIPISTAVITGFLPAAILLIWILGGNYRQTWHLISKSRIVQFSLALFLWLVLAGVCWGPGWESLTTLKKYRELLLIPIIMSFTSQMGLKKRYSIANAVGAGLLVTLAISLFQSAGLMPLKNGHATMSNTLTQASLMAWGMFWMLHQFRQTGSKKWLFCAGFAGAHAMFMMNSTTGTILVMGLFFLYAYQAMRLKLQLIATVCILGLTTIGFLYNEKFQREISESFGIGGQIIKGETIRPEQFRNSAGERYQFLVIGAQIFKESPIIGHGAGSVLTEYKMRANAKGWVPIDNLHNEFLMIGAQAGMIGVMFFMGLFSVIIKVGPNVCSAQRWMIQGIAAWMIMGCSLNSFLLDAREGMMFALLVSVYGTIGPKYGIGEK